MEDSQSNSNVFSVRIVSIDYYMTPPINDMDICYSSFQGGKVKEVPVIRIYGSTPAGQKTCLHIHRALPYLYVPCSELSIQPDNSGDGCTHALSLAVEKALKLKGNTGSKRQHVHGCSVVQARKLYGYNSSEECFFKIFLYHPQDVSRTANLLLGGAILDKVLQPHESHIPFLLQFLIDYNLYGMGHLHVSKMMFRVPVPDGFWSKAKKNRQHTQNTDNTSCSPADFLVDSSGHACSGLPIWTSSTIPAGWIWQQPSQLDSPAGSNTNIVARQSTCQLEGDASVDEILNQQNLLYSSLSQTSSDIKMVQSLIPIWEEFEKAGMHGVASLSVPGKPPPGDVLRTLSDGVEFVDKYMEFCSDTSTDFGNKAVSLQPIRFLSANHNVDECDPEKVNEIGVSSQGTTYVDAKNRRGVDLCAEQLSANEVLGTVGSSGVKTADQEALMLLKWLASSQAAEDINSDDELARETFLSPLMPATTMEKVLERANVDYESQSQQECQDILDCVEDSIGVEALKGKASHGGDHCQKLGKKNFPVMDASNDDQILIACTAKSSEMQTKCEDNTSSHANAPVNFGSNVATNHKRKRPLQMSQCCSFFQDFEGDIHPESANLIGTSSESKYDILSCTGEDSETKRSCNAVACVEKDSECSEEARVQFGSSMRDLMRRKRCYRVEQLENHTPHTKVYYEAEWEKNSSLCTEGNGQEIKPPKRKLSLSAKQTEICERDTCEEQSISEAASVVKPEESVSSRYGKLPLISYGDHSYPTSINDDINNSIVTAPTLRPGNIFLSPAAVLGVTKKTPQLVNSKSQNNAAEAGYCNNRNNEDSNDVSNVMALNFDGSCKPDPCCRKLNFDDDKLFETEEVLQTDAVCSSCPCTCQTVNEVSDNKGYISDCHNIIVHSQRVSKVVAENSEGIKLTIGSTLIHTGCSNSGQQCRDTCITGSGSSMPMVVNTEANPKELIVMGYYMKPPSRPLIDGISGNAPTSSAVLSFAYPIVEQYEATPVQDRVLDDCLPFFGRDCIERKENQNARSIAEESSHHQRGIMGVPAHFQNDGSSLYMLTPAISPPSLDNVARWLSQDDTGSHGSPTDACRGPILESGPLSNEDTIKAQVHQQHQGSHNTKMQPFHNETAKLLDNIGTKLDKQQDTGFSENISQISGPDGKSKLTPLSQTGFCDPASIGGGQQLSIFSIEIQAQSRGDSLPDPRLDAVNFIVVVILEDDDLITETHILLRTDTGHVQRNLDGLSGCKIFVFSEEKNLFNHFIKLVCSSDPDILMGWDIQGGSLGFLAERAAHIGIGLLNKISRTPSQTSALMQDLDIHAKSSDALSESAVAESSVLEDAIIEDEWGRTHASGVHVTGRIILNCWRLVRSEVKLNMYSSEAVAEEVLRRKIPHIPSGVLTKWFSSGPGRSTYRCIEYIIQKAKLNIQIMTQLDMINRTSELARVFGIDFFSVLSRGSQYRVESMLLRLAHTQNYLAIAPGSQQVASQPAMECLPLVMEPESGFYADPVVVLDFQSLYPSMIIAYNLCFSTCLGKLTPSKSNTLGVSSYSPDPNVLLDFKHEILLTPNGVMYVPSKVRKGVLPRLLEEILSTRIMVKQAMKKLDPSEKVRARIFNARQLALKLIANVTYGYTAAGFSGRMPCAELADSIVQCGRRTLETAIAFVNAHEKWNAQVIYGDTDSMFVLLRGRSVNEALTTGQEIASTVTAMNPNPVTLKLEKVYHPCFLLTKKRYVGYSYESPNQVDPIFDAKGIETVRRDTCGAVSKTMEQSLRLYFEHQNISKVKLYLLRQWKRILSGRVSLQDFVFAKEVRLGTYSTRASSLPPAAIVATKAMRNDPRAEPRYAERIPYVVVHGEPGARLVDMVIDPLELLAIDSPYRLNDLYYINKQIIPALQRIFTLVGANLNQWFQEMPRPGQKVFGKHQFNALNPNRTRIDYYYLSRHCILCGEMVQASAYVCSKCSKHEATVATAVVGRTSKLEREIQHLADICRHCGGGDWIIESGVKCTSLACSVFFERRKIQKELQSLSAIATEANLYPRCMVEWF